MNLSGLVLCLLLTGEPAVWPGFLGAGASPIVEDSLPLKWSPTENVAWKATLPGHGQSSPVIWGDTVFVTAVEGSMKETNHLVTLSLKDGSMQWSYKSASSFPVKSSLYVSRAAPTPVVDSRHVYAYFESGDVIAMTHEGKVAWHRSLSKEFGNPQNKFGLSASPVQTDDAVFVLIDDAGPSYLIALNKVDGTTKWKTDRTSRQSWASPALHDIAGRRQIVVSSAGSVEGFDPANGERLWLFTEIGGNTAPTPLSAGSGRFLIGASPGREGDNTAIAKQSNLVMEVVARDGRFVPEVVWRTTDASPSFSSPVVHRGFAYWVNRAGVVYCFDATTGQQLYAERSKQTIWASPLGVGNRVYLFGKEGVTTVLKSGPKFEVLAENELWDPASIKVDEAKAAEGEDTPERRRAAAMFAGPVQYGVAAVSGSLLIRTGDSLVCLRQKN